MKQAKQNNPSNKSSASTSEGAGVDTSAQKKHHLALFDHLPHRITPTFQESIGGDRTLHAATIKLATLFYSGIVQEDDDRVIALIVLFSTLVQDYTTPPKRSLREDLDKYVAKQVCYGLSHFLFFFSNHFFFQVQCLVDARPLSKSMGNVIKYVRHCISKVKIETSEADAKVEILEKLKSFIEDRIQFAGDSIARYITSIIRDGDVLLTFGTSALLRKVLVKAAETKTFSLIVVDTRPLNEGLHTLHTVAPHVRCTYVPLSGASHAMRDVKRVILGASCLMSNGTMLAPAGTAVIAALAKNKQIPVVVAVESYKFSEKVQLDSIVFNELGSLQEIAVETVTTTAGVSTHTVCPQKVAGYRGNMDKVTTPVDSAINAGSNIFHNWEVIATPKPLPSSGKLPAGTKPKDLPFDVVNLRYDLTPIRNISVVATETGLIPPTSVPVLIREMALELNAQNDA